MSEKIDSLALEARRLAHVLKETPEECHAWYQRSHLLSFASTIEERKDEAGLSLAAQSLQYLIADQWDFGAEFTKQALALAKKADVLSKDLKTEANQPPDPTRYARGSS